MVPAKLKPLTMPANNRATTKAMVHFLSELWCCYSPTHYTFLGSRRGSQWRDHPIRRDREAEIADVLANFPPDRFDIYFCPNAFAKPQRRQDLALPSRYAWCDIDDADPYGYNPAANILWETSPLRFQGIWIWPEPTEGRVAEQYSRNLVYGDGGDRGGWSITKMLRVPGTINHKSDYCQPFVKLHAYIAGAQRLPRSIATVEVTKHPISSCAIDAPGIEANLIMRRYRRAMGLQAGTLMMATRVMRPDRSGAVYQIVSALIAAGAGEGEIATVLLTNPYFTSKWGEDIIEAERQIHRIRDREGRGR